MGNNYAKKIVEMLEKADQPQDIEKIRTEVGIGNWNTALKHCLQLVIADKIKGTKTSKSWIFWIDKREVPAPTGGTDEAELAKNFSSEERGSWLT